MGVDDILIKSNTESIEVTDESQYAPSLAVAYGFPYRIEGNLRYFPPRFTELTLRHQVNPPSFDLFDGSVNLHLGHVFGGYSYLKYGVSVSKDIHGFEPVVHYSGYHFLGAHTGDFSEGFRSGLTDDFINRNRVIGFGIGIPLSKGKFFPEVDYKYFGNLGTGLWHFGIGLRVEIE